MGTQGGTEMSQIAVANKLGRKMAIIIISLLGASYILMGRNDGLSITQIIILELTLWVPVVAAALAYKKNPDSKAIKHIIGIGYGLFYITVCCFSDVQLVYTYAFPMLIIVLIYCDLKFSRLVSSAVVVIATIHSVMFWVKSGLSDVSRSSMVIEICTTVFVAFYSITSTKFIFNLQEKQIVAAKEANNKAEEMLSKIMEVSNSLAGEVSDVSERMEELKVSSRDTYAAMQEVQTGSTDTAESVQNQLLKTEEIQKQVANVTEAANNIGENVTTTLGAIAEGRNNIAALIKQAEASEVAGNGAVDEVQALKNYTSQMESIVSIIQEVASQTSLLSLNASIEAARAGEAGRGFAVVASEISNLASQTQDATENISKLISSVTGKMEEVANAITVLVDSNKAQNESAHVTAGSFEKIAGNTDEIKTNSQELTHIVGKLDDANKEIVESIQTISAISEEVSAHSTTTCEKSEQNEEIVNEVQGIVVKMTENAEKLKNI